jgi:hypothetical protein
MSPLPVFFQQEFEVDDQVESFSTNNSDIESEDVTILTVDDLTIESFESSRPDLYAQLRNRFIAEGKRLERQHFEQLKKACGDNALLLGKCILSEEITGEVLMADIDKLEVTNKEQAQKIEQFQEVKSIQGLSEQQLRDRFAASQALRDEFHDDVESYLAYVKHELKKARDRK